MATHFFKTHWKEHFAIAIGFFLLALIFSGLNIGIALGLSTLVVPALLLEEHYRRLVDQKNKEIRSLEIYKELWESKDMEELRKFAITALEEERQLRGGRVLTKEEREISPAGKTNLLEFLQKIGQIS